MQEMIRFRSQLGGFHRADVANYMEKTARKHAEELAALRDELTCAKAEKLDALEQVRLLTAQLEALESGEPMPREVLPEDPEASELAAYRRAEAAERTANARIRRQMERLSELMADAAGEHAQVSGELAALMQSVAADLAQMQALFGKVEETFGRTEASMEELKKEIAE